MITVRELAAECDCSADDVLVQLSVLNVFTLGRDSFVRDEDAATVRRNLMIPGIGSSDSEPAATDEQPHVLREKLRSATPSSRSLHTRPAVTPFEIGLQRATVKRQVTQNKPKGKHGYPGGDPLNPLEQAIVDRIVPWGERARRRPPGMIFFDELQTIKRIHKQWAQACIEAGHLMSDEQIIAWLEAFPNRDLDPREVIAVASEGVTPANAALHLWYGRVNPFRPTLFDRICCKDITVEEAKTQIERHKHAG